MLLLDSKKKVANATVVIDEFSVLWLGRFQIRQPIMVKTSFYHNICKALFKRKRDNTSCIEQYYIKRKITEKHYLWRRLQIGHSLRATTRTGEIIGETRTLYRALKCNIFCLHNLVHSSQIYYMKPLLFSLRFPPDHDPYLILQSYIKYITAHARPLLSSPPSPIRSFKALLSVRAHKNGLKSGSTMEF